MKKFFKLFRTDKREIIPVEYTAEDQKNYFKYIMEQSNNGLKQVIVTSELMLKILEMYFVECRYQIINIKFAEEDSDLETQIQLLIESANKDRAYFFKLVEKLSCIANSSSIDIEKIEMKGFDNITKEYSYFSIQVNGIIIVKKGNIDSLIKKIANRIRENL